MEKINIAELLKDCPKGMELDCTIYDNIYFDGFNNSKTFPINIGINTIGTWCSKISLDKYGRPNSHPNAKCIIFPKGKTTWEGFQRPFKDGDIVTWDDRGSLIACIYKERKNTACFNHHIALYKGGLGIVENGEIALPDKELSFATEEEKQQLFDAIKENGYKWNDETNTLEKLIEPKFKTGDKIKHKDSGVYCTLGEYAKGISAYMTSIGLSLTYKDLEQWELAPNKFDITTLKPFDKVLVRYSFSEPWNINYFSYIDSAKMFKTIMGTYLQCIPYEGNEYLLGTFEDCNDYYKTWK